MQTYFAPEFQARKFTCPYCIVVANQVWIELFYKTSGGGVREEDDMKVSACSHCNRWCYWYKQRLVVPANAPVESAHPDTPDSCKPDYDEARDIAGRSPRAAAALIRLALQKLMSTLGEKGKNINDDIASLVGKGLPAEVQQALDICRVVGNNAVHPGEMSMNETQETAHSLFHMFNFIIEDRISRPKKIAGIYKQLPKAALDAIQKRDRVDESGKQ